MSTKSVISNSALILSAEVLERILRLILVVYSARILGDTDYGKFTFALGFTSLFLILADGGIHQLLVREVARAPERVKEFIANGLLLKLFLSVFTAASIYFCINLTGKSVEVKTAVYIFGACQICISFSDFFTSIFRAFQRMKYDMAATTIGGLSTILLGLAVLFSGGNFLLLAVMYLTAQLIRLLYCLIVTRLRFSEISLQWHFPLIKFLLKEGFPFGILYFFSMMYTYVDTTMLSIMKGDEVVGWYNAAYRLVFAMMFIPIGAMKAVFPTMSVYYKESLDAFKKLFYRTFKTMFLIGFSISSLLYIISDRIILLVFGPEYINAAGALKILVWSTAIIFIGTVQTHITRSSNQQGFTAKVVASSAVLNLGLNLLLIPKYSYYGAAIATLASELFTFILHFWFLSKKLEVPPLFRLAPKIIVINLVVMFYVSLVSEFNLLIIVPTALIINLIMLFVTRYFTKEEISFIVDLVKSIKKPAKAVV